MLSVQEYLLRAFRFRPARSERSIVDIGKSALLFSPLLLSLFPCPLFFRVFLGVRNVLSDFEPKEGEREAEEDLKKKIKKSGFPLCTQYKLKSFERESRKCCQSTQAACCDKRFPGGGYFAVEIDTKKSQ